MPPRLSPMQPPASRFSTASIQKRSFSQTCPNQLRRLPRFIRSKINSVEMKEFIDWASTEGIKYKKAPNAPNYLQLQRRRNIENVDESTAEDDRGGNKGSGRRGKEDRKGAANPFPLNPYFKSQPVLSEALKEELYHNVAIQGRSLRQTSTYFKVSMERVAAVVRMKQMERDWLEEGKRLVPFFTEKVMKMLPQTGFTPSNIKGPEYHESINDLPVHSSTTQQIFWPTSESREFTRIDAGKVFQNNLLPSDMRIPHPQMIDQIAARTNTTRSIAMERMREDLEIKLNKEATEKARKEQESTLVVQGPRFDFKIEDVNVDWVGKDGRSRKGVGYRYGMPHEDRKRGLIKVPTSAP